MIIENEQIIRNADLIEFEATLKTIDGIPQSVPDIKLTITENGITKIKLGEVYAGTAGAKSNLASQSLTYFNNITDIRDLRFFRRMNIADKAQAKEAVIDAWKNGGVLENEKVFNLFKKYDNEIVKSFSLNSKTQLEGYLKENSDWFNLIFNSNF